MDEVEISKFIYVCTQELGCNCIVVMPILSMLKKLILFVVKVLSSSQCSVVAGNVVVGNVAAGNVVAGDVVAGKTAAGNAVAGKTTAGKTAAGNVVSKST